MQARLRRLVQFAIGIKQRVEEAQQVFFAELPSGGC